MKIRNFKQYLRRHLPRIHPLSEPDPAPEPDPIAHNYRQWRTQFLRERLRPALWIGIILSLTITLYLWGEAIFAPTRFQVSNLWTGMAVEVGLITCLYLHSTSWGQRYPEWLFLGSSWSLTLIVQLGVAWEEEPRPQLELWSLAFLTQATLMPVRWQLHLISQIGVIATYVLIKMVLHLQLNSVMSPYEQTRFYLYLFWFCFICDLSVYWYEKLQRHEFIGRRKLETAYHRLEVAEAKYHSIFENAVEGIFQSTPDGHYLTANPALAHIYGYQSPEELMQQLQDIAHQLYVDPKKRLEFIQQMEKQDQVSEFVSQVYRKDGSIVWISENARAVRSETGELLYYEGLIEDITKRKQAEESLRAFIHAVSHDLRNPVTGLLLTFKQWRKQTGSEIKISPEMLQRMIEGSERQLNLINSLLEAHASEVRGLMLQIKPMQLYEIVEAAINDLQPLLKYHRATLTNQVPQKLPWVNVDALQLWRVFSNLITNSLKHNAPGLKLTVTATVEGETICCTVEDNGIGIEPEQCQQLFELYTRGRQARHSIGLGLGLYLCRQIITAHGGEINAISVPGAGVTFWFTLPVASQTCLE